MGAPKQKWTSEEETALRAGVLKHGPGKWRTILKDPEYSGVLSSRSNVDLKDKWRNMTVMANGWGSREKSKVTIKRLHRAPKQDEGSLGLTNVTHSEEESSECKQVATSSCSPPNCSSKRPILLLDNLVMDAINNLKEPDGSSKKTIAAYIEDQYWAPPDFKRILSSKLKYLTATGKLMKMSRKYRIALSKVVQDDINMLAKSEINLELPVMRGMTPLQEAAIVAAQAVAEAEAAMAEAEKAVREADAAEADVEAALAFEEATMKTMQGRNTPRMMIRA